MKKLYQEHKGRGFTIVGISLDEFVKDVERAVAKHGITWPQICDGKGFESELAMLYNVPGTPAYYLLDRQGKLKAKKISAAKLNAAVAEALGSQPN